MHFDTFHEWFKEQVKELEATSNILKDVKVLARGPSYITKRFSAFDVNNGYRFRTKQSEEFKVTQNSSVMVVSKTESYASTSDNAPKSANITYYGRLNDIVELNYYEKFKVTLFKCDWVDITKGRGIKEDDLGFTLVNFSHLTDSGDRECHEPFIFAEQAQQVIFVQDPQDHEWFVPRLIKPRDIFNMGEENNVQLESSTQSDATDLAILENVRVLEDDYNDWKFSIPRRGEAYVLKSLGKKWKDYKCDLKGEYLPKYKTKDALLKNRPSRIPRDQWSGLVSYWLLDKAKRRAQANRNNRANQKMPHIGGSKSIATLMDEQAVNGVGPTRAQVFLLTHTKCKDGRPLDDDSAKAIEIINERMNNSDSSTDQPPRSVAWEGDVYSQVFGNDKSGYVRDLGLGPTPSVLWGSRSSLGNIVAEDSSNEAVQRLIRLMRPYKG
nr:uncharacterized protein LOC104096812 isoform X2 [Nicotiana tomentosiformis]